MLTVFLENVIQRSLLRLAKEDHLIAIRNWNSLIPTHAVNLLEPAEPVHSISIPEPNHEPMPASEESEGSATDSDDNGYELDIIEELEGVWEHDAIGQDTDSDDERVGTSGLDADDFDADDDFDN